MGLTGMPRESVLKVGSTFWARCLYEDAVGDPVDLVSAGIKIASRLRTARGAVLPLELRIADQATAPGRFDLVSSTANWPIGVLQWDIRARQGRVIVTSASARVIVQPSVTPAEALPPIGTDLDASAFEPTFTATVVGGFPGPRGRDGTASFPTIAVGPLSGHRAVKAVAGGVGYPDLATPADGDLILGVTDGAADDGDTIQVQAGGLIIEPSWSWSLGPVFAGDAGHLTQTPPAGAWLRQIGTAVALDRIIISLRPTIIRLL